MPPPPSPSYGGIEVHSGELGDDDAVVGAGSVAMLVTLIGWVHRPGAAITAVAAVVVERSGLFQE